MVNIYTQYPYIAQSHWENDNSIVDILFDGLHAGIVRFCHIPSFITYLSDYVCRHIFMAICVIHMIRDVCLLARFGVAFFMLIFNRLAQLYMVKCMRI